jgi:hypothetical protein
MRIESTAKAAPRPARDLLVPNPRLRLREQVHEVMRFKQYSVRTEGALKVECFDAARGRSPLDG